MVSYNLVYTRFEKGKTMHVIIEFVIPTLAAIIALAAVFTGSYLIGYTLILLVGIEVGLIAYEIIMWGI